MSARTAHVLQLDPVSTRQSSEPSRYRLLIRVLGPFCVQSMPHAVEVGCGSKGESLLAYLALHHDRWVLRSSLLDLLWPDSDQTLAGQSLNSLTYSLRKRIKEEVDGLDPVTQADGRYRLNIDAGVGVDSAWFDNLVEAGNRQTRAGQGASAAVNYHRAIELYRGDLCVDGSSFGVAERERLRASFLSVLMRLADYHYEEGDYNRSLNYVLRVLTNDPLREDAHRRAMQCYVRLGARAQALRQYRLCQEILRAEFDAPPEPATVALFNRIRLDPASL